MKYHTKLVIQLLFSLFITIVFSWECDSYDLETATNMNLFWLDEIDDSAVCNDGTPSGYFFSAVNNSRTWLVYLSGGSWCYSEESCNERWNAATIGQDGYSGLDHMSSSNWSNTCLKTGIFDRNSSLNPLATANKIYIPYCTSDAFMGDVSASNSTFGWYFRGQRVVKAVFEALKNRHGLADGDTVVFGGGSAGARGALVSVEAVTTYIPSDVKLMIFLDSPYYIDVSPYNISAFDGFGYQTQQIFQLVNPTNLITESCRLMYSEEQWKCLFGEFRMPFLDQSYLLIASQYDKWQLEYNLMTSPNTTANPPWSGDMLTFANLFGKLTQTLVTGLPPLSRKSDSSVYSDTCYSHHISETPNFWIEKTLENVTESDALTYFLLGGSGQQWIDRCEGFECGTGCTDYYNR